MAKTVYVSKNGNNANDGLTLATAKRTLWDPVLTGAHTLAVDGDTILFDDGVYSGAEIELAAGNGYINSVKALHYDSINPYGATLASTSVTGGVFKMTGAFANKTLSFGKIIMDGDGIVPNYGIQFSPTSGPATLNLGDLKIMKSVFSAVQCSQANTVQVFVSDNGAELHSNRAAVNIPTLGAASDVTLSNTKCHIIDKTQAVGAIVIKATGAGCRATILEPKINISYANTFPAQADFGIRLTNIDYPLVYNPQIEATTLSATGTIDAVSIDCDDAVLTALRPRIIGGELRMDTNGGIGAVIGHDTPNAGDHRSNFGLIQGVKVYGTDRWASNVGHAVMLGYTTNSLATGNEAHNVGIGLLMKGTTTCRMAGNKVKKAAAAFMEFKGATDSSFDGNTLYLDGAAGHVFVTKLNNQSANAPNTNCSADGNIIVLRSSFSGQLSDIVAGDTNTTMTKNIYAIAETATMSANPLATVGASTYATLSSFLAAVDANASIVRTFPDDPGGAVVWLEVAPGISLPI
jgi:hypothetical protein